MHTILFSVGHDSSEMIHMMRMMLPLIQADPLHQEVFESRLAQKKIQTRLKAMSSVQSILYDPCICFHTP